ncbi:hypothetical protein KQI68_06480 [Peptoniphilus sp. MSJ-1]|uniref:Uncharacterized protein n=1 Tax=Peptoniphilus ovalis TaxID=2841503 RepID=A0ABS6FHG6_9FIRM|nr:hypothetical protein [Peptoniphilus ovalis]MBU5669483.1 hypothetical protein [Peptoniphilus ovalis]
MKLSIKFKPRCDERPWLIVRENGEYEQHAHLKSKKDALKVRNIIDRWVYPYCKDYKIAVQRLLTEEEFKSLDKKQRYFNPQKGIR